MSKRNFPLILSLFIYFTFLGGSLYSITSFPLKVFNHGLVTLIVGLWLWRKIRRAETEPLPRTLLDWPILFWLAVQLLSAAFGRYPRFSFESLWQPITHMLAFYLLLDLLPTQRGNLTRALYLSSAVVCFIGLFEFASWYFGLPLLASFDQSWAKIGGLAQPIPPYWYRLNFTLNGATSLSAYLALLIPPALAMWLTVQKKDDRQVLAAWLVLAVIVEILTFSRGGILALGLSLPLLVLVWFYLKPPQQLDFLRAIRLPRRVIIGGIALALLAGLVGLIFFQQRVTTHGSGDQVRLNLWQSAIRMALDRPLLGVGPKIYGNALRAYRDPTLARDQITTAHSLYLNTAAETGVLGLLAGGWLIGALALAAWRNWQATEGTNARLRLASVGAALIGFGVQNAVDTFNATQIILPLLLGTAYLLTPHQVWKRSPQENKATVLALRPQFLLALVLVYALLLGWWDTAQADFQNAARAAGRGDFKAALASAEDAARLDPQLTLYRFEVAYYQSRLATEDPAYLRKAIDTYQAALHVEDTNPTYYTNLAGLLTQAGRLEEAKAAIEQALALSPDMPILWLNRGYINEKSGLAAAAQTDYQAAATAFPDFVDTGFWSPSQRARIIANIQQQGADPLLLGQLALANGEPDRAESFARQSIAAAPTQIEGHLALIRALLAQDRPAEAATVLAEQFPDFGTIAGGELYLLRGQANWQQQQRIDRIEKDLRTALFIDPFENALAYYELGQIYEAEGHLPEAKNAYARAVPPQISSQNYDIVVYGRGTTHPPYVPQVIYIGLGEASAAPWLRLLELYRAEGETKAAERVIKRLQTLYPYLETPDLRTRQQR